MAQKGTPHRFRRAEAAASGGSRHAGPLFQKPPGAVQTDQLDSIGRGAARSGPCALSGHGFTVGLVEERHESVGAEVEVIGPNIIAGEVDAVPAER